MFLFDPEFTRLLQDEVRVAVLEALRDIGPLLGQPPTFSNQRLMTRQEVAQYLNISLGTVDNWARNGKLNAN